MSLDVRLTSLVQTIAADVKSLYAQLAVVKSIELAVAYFTSTVTATTTMTDVPGFFITVPANSGPVCISVDNLILSSQATSAIGTVSCTATFQIVDETNALVAFGRDAVVVYATTTASARVMALMGNVPNYTISKTYRVQFNAASTTTAKLYSSASGYSNPQLKATRR